jgi:hypothetical protein
MMPFNLSFRRLIQKYIPQLKSEDLDRHESLLALRLQLGHERNYDPALTPPPSPNDSDFPGKSPSKGPLKGKPGEKAPGENPGDMQIKGKDGVGDDASGGQNTTGQPDQPPETPYQKDISSKIEHVSREAKAIIAPVAPLFNLVHRLWIARRQFALEQGHFLQIPPTVEGLVRFVKAAMNYALISIATLPRLEVNRIRYFIKNLSPVGVIVSIGLIVLTVIAVDVSGSGGNEAPGDDLMPPEIGDLPGFSISEGDSFPPLLLDNFVSDPNDAPETLTWTASAENELTVSIDENRATTVNIPHPDWNGRETITFTVTDPAGLSDSGQTTFMVNGVNDAPEITSTPVDNARFGQLYKYPLTAEDPDLPYGDVLKYTLLFAPGFLSIDSLSGLVSGTPSENFIGQDSVGVKVTDSEGASDVQRYILIVTD